MRSARWPLPRSSSPAYPSSTRGPRLRALRLATAAVTAASFLTEAAVVDHCCASQWSRPVVKTKQHRAQSARQHPAARNYLMTHWPPGPLAECDKSDLSTDELDATFGSAGPRSHPLLRLGTNALCRGHTFVACRPADATISATLAPVVTDWCRPAPKGERLLGRQDRIGFTVNKRCRRAAFDLLVWTQWPSPICSAGSPYSKFVYTVTSVFRSFQHIAGSRCAPPTEGIKSAGNGRGGPASKAGRARAGGQRARRPLGARSAPPSSPFVQASQFNLFRLR